MVSLEAFQQLEARFARVEQNLQAEGGGGTDRGLVQGRNSGSSDAQVLKKVSTRLQDFEAQITAQLSNLQSDFDKKLSHVNRGASSMKALDGSGPSAGFDTMAEDLDQLKYDVGELKDLLSNNKGEVNCDRGDLDAEVGQRRHPGDLEEPRHVDGGCAEHLAANAGEGGEPHR
mmetsp:Transcript_3988/g.13387  ORF Transcript_3988/g.13387 Transcript_3988/m.13387 type:complete len:173 (-) Transcript_3988:52-570(-)